MPTQLRVDLNMELKLIQVACIPSTIASAGKANKQKDNSPLSADRLSHRWQSSTVLLNEFSELPTNY
jgi:hypothetical protein